MNKIILAFAAIMTASVPAAAMEQAVVVAKFGTCDYFIADGSRGLFVLEWYGGYEPDEGDTIVGDIASYGFKDVYYPNNGTTGRLWVEDYLESKTSAMEEIIQHCN